MQAAAAGNQQASLEALRAIFQAYRDVLWERLVVNFGWLDVLTRTRGVMDDAVLPVIWAALREGFGSRQ